MIKIKAFQSQSHRDGEHMTTLRQEAMAYVPAQKTLNIADLKRVSVDVEIKTKEGKDRDGTGYTYKYIEVEGKEYRIPGPVIRGLKGLVEKFPQMKHFSVMKDGEGQNTKYQVVPLLDSPA